MRTRRFIRRDKALSNAILATTAAACGLVVLPAHADPLVNVQMLGWDLTTLGPAPASANQYLPNLQVNPGDTVVYSILTYMSPTGTFNTNSFAVNSGGVFLSKLVNNVDGINTLTFDAYQLTADQIQVDFKNGVPIQTSVTSSGQTATLAPAQGISLTSGNTGWKNVFAASGGTLGHPSTSGARTGPANDLVLIRPGQSPGTFRGLFSSQPVSNLGTGLFVVSSTGTGALSTVKMRYSPTTEGGSGGGFGWNNFADAANLTDLEEAGTDPFTTYSGLTLSTSQVTSWNTDADGNWSNAANWTTNASPNSPTASPLLGSKTTAARQVTLDVPVTAASLTIASMQPYTVAGPGSLSTSSINVSAGSHAISAPVATGSGVTISASPSTVLTLTGSVSGTGSLTKSGPGSLTLSPSNSYTGGTTLTSGSIQITDDSALGAANTPLTFTGGKLQAASSLTLSRAIVFNGLGGAIDTNGFNSTITSTLSGGASLTKLGTGTLVLNSPPTFPGPTSIFAGVLKLGTPQVLQNSTVNLNIDNGLDLSGFSATLGNLGGTASMNLGDASMNLSVGNNGSNSSYSGALTGSGSLTKTGSGALEILGTNSYSGATNFNGGVLVASKSAALGNLSPSNFLAFNTGTLKLKGSFATNRAVFVNSGGGTIDTNFQTLTFGGTIAGTGVLTKTGSGSLVLTNSNNSSDAGISVTGGSLDIAGNNQTLASLILAGGAIVATTGSISAANFNVETGTNSAILAGTGSLTKTTSSTFTLTTANTYSGPTTITAGTLAASSSANLGNDSPTNSLVLNGGTFQPTASFSMKRGLILNGTVGTISTSGDFNAITIAGPITGTGGLTKTGSGALWLTGPGTYSGPTTISDGTLVCNGPNVLSPFSDYTIGRNTLFLRGFSQTVGSLSSTAGGTVILETAPVILTVGANNTSSTFAGTITGSGGITKTGTGDFRLNSPFGTNYAGPTTINGGRLIVTSASGIVGGFRTFDVSGGALVNNGTIVGTISLNSGGISDGSGLFLTTVTVNSGGVIRGTGEYRGSSVAGVATYSGGITLNSGGTISPGNSPGTLTSNSGLINAGAIYDFDIRDANGPAGAGTDLWHITHQLTLDPIGPIFIHPQTLDPSNNPGQASNFDPGQRYSWILVQADTGILNFFPNAFAIDSSSFLNSLNGGSFSIAQSGNDLLLDFTPVPEPSLIIFVPGAALLLLNRRRRQSGS